MNQYELYKGLLRGYSLPQALVDLDHLDQNLNDLLEQCPNHLVRVASKSVRCIEVLKYLKNSLGNKYAGIMAYHPQESLMLSEEDLGDILLAYPYAREEDFAGFQALHLEKICFMVDVLEHLSVLNNLGDQLKQPVRVCIDIDMSVDLKILNFGVYRSSINSEKKLKALLEHLKHFPYVKVVGLMGYEAQIAGLADKNPHTQLNRVYRLLKSIFAPVVNKRREKMVEFLKAEFDLEFINGGGTASLPTTTKDKSITEVTIGSGFYCPQLFSFYKHLHLKPAAFFAVEITRNPKPNYYTCAGGGYIASGSPSWDKVPHPYLPPGAKLTSNEACGEVQTPVYYPGSLKVGDPFFFRHSKAGELCERFNQLILIKDNKIWKTAQTYRGMGACFL